MGTSATTCSGGAADTPTTGSGVRDCCGGLFDPMGNGEPARAGAVAQSGGASGVDRHAPVSHPAAATATQRLRAVAAAPRRRDADAPSKANVIAATLVLLGGENV